MPEGPIKGQLISKQNCRAITSPKKRIFDFQVYYLKVSTKESYLLAKRLSFCINLEVVIFQDSEFGLFFERRLDTIICFRNLLTFSLKNCRKNMENFPGSPKYDAKHWTNNLRK